LSPAARRLLMVLTALLAAAPGTAEARTVEVQGHRGGSVIDGVPRFPENMTPAFENAAARGYTIELDVKLSRDRVPVVIHDDTLDRTTICSGPVSDFSARRLARCQADVLGSPGSVLSTRALREPEAGVSRLKDVLALAKRTGTRVNMEIKNLPTDNDWDPTYDYARRIMRRVVASKVPADLLIVQSFVSGNLEAAREVSSRYELSLLTLKGGEEGGLTMARERRYDWISPSWPVSADFVARAHGAGLKVVPYTLDRKAEVRAAVAAGVDALISDDPAMARCIAGARSDPPRALGAAAAGRQSRDAGWAANAAVASRSTMPATASGAPVDHSAPRTSASGGPETQVSSMPFRTSAAVLFAPKPEPIGR
jgi:glycerophosphoryl diester phosphodiesterase